MTFSEIRDLRIVDVIVETPKPAEGGQPVVVWPKAGMAYASTQMPASTRPVSLGRDPAGAGNGPTPEESAWDEKFMALSRSAAAQTQMHSTLAQVTRDSFRKRFTEQPSGKHAAKLKVVVKSLMAPGGQATFTADVIVLDGVTGRPLTQYPNLLGIRTASTAVVPATPVGILVGLAALAVADQIRGDPAYEAIDSASSAFSGWLLRE
ncbi:hypothetical protein DWF00_11170 [Bosea caraganae]|uniref:Uncharacterized protein n=1 Tax=Bosea caraganae TaxID=2763117 RepID=A0A370LC10_9HYPH|nr:hypothetical protein DWF00_11170 [Bosea caraganae]RDJ29514.1 hypothetical protein DWE98_02940 [Bosea caraganae]